MHALSVLLFGLPLVVGCTVLTTKPMVTAPLQGQIDNNFYIGPEKLFRVRLPLLSRNAAIKDEVPTYGTLLLTIADDLCREFVISQRPGYLGTRSLESWVDEHIVQDLKRSNLAVQSKTVTTHNGPAVVLRYRAPAAAPCSRATAVAGEKVGKKLDADVGWYVYHRAGHFYRVLYYIGIGPEAPRVWYINRDPVDEVLVSFADGFKILDNGQP